MINAIIRVQATEQTRMQILRALRALIEPIRVEKGCASCALYGDLQDANTIVLVQRWSTRNDLERHVRTPQYRKILEVLEMSSEEPEIRFDTVVETSGLQLIAGARGVETDTD